MKKIYSLLLITIICSTKILLAQSYQWVNSYPVQYSMNPSLPQHSICVSDAGLVFASQLDSSSLVYSQDVLGKQVLRCINTSGVLQWSVSLGKKVTINRIATDNAGNVYIGGIFMDSLKISNSTLALSNTGINFTTNTYIAKFDVNGNAVYLKNKTGGQFNSLTVAALAVNSQGELYYAVQDFGFDSYIRKVDAAGNDIQTYTINEARTIGQISFDPNDNLYVSGSTSQGTFTVNNLSVAVPEAYMMFVSRINSNGQTSWIRLAHDVTFQFPIVAAGNDGSAFLSCALLDNTTWGAVSFNGPQWVYGMFLTKVDSAGNFLWGVFIPATPTIQGDFSPGTNVFIDDDALGNVYVTGVTRGTVSWGNGVTTGSAAIPSSEISYMCFNSAGTPQWQLGGSSSSFETTYTIDADSIGNCYFASGISGSGTFGTFNLNTGGAQAAVFGKISSPFVAVQNHVQQNEVNIFPNPSNDCIKVIAGTEFVKSIKSVSVKNMQGQTVYSQKYFQPVINVQQFAQGVYTIEIDSSSKKIIEKFIKQ